MKKIMMILITLFSLSASAEEFEAMVSITTLHCLGSEMRLYSSFEIATKSEITQETLDYLKTIDFTNDQYCTGIDMWNYRMEARRNSGYIPAVVNTNVVDNKFKATITFDKGTEIERIFK